MPQDFERLIREAAAASIDLTSHRSGVAIGQQVVVDFFKSELVPALDFLKTCSRFTYEMEAEPDSRSLPWLRIETNVGNIHIAGAAARTTNGGKGRVRSISLDNQKFKAEQKDFCSDFITHLTHVVKNNPAMEFSLPPVKTPRVKGSDAAP